jgi:hypothetical protein
MDVWLLPLAHHHLHIHPINNLNTNTNTQNPSVRIEVFHPFRQMIQLQTNEPLRLLTALRTWVSIAYLGTPPAFVGIRMRIPPELAPPLPPIKVTQPHCEYI